MVPLHPLIVARLKLALRDYCKEEWYALDSKFAVLSREKVMAELDQKQVGNLSDTLHEGAPCYKTWPLRDLQRSIEQNRPEAMLVFGEESDTVETIAVMCGVSANEYLCRTIAARSANLQRQIQDYQQNFCCNERFIIPLAYRQFAEGKSIALPEIPMIDGTSHSLLLTWARQQRKQHFLTRL